MTVTKPLNNPGRHDINKDRQVVGAVGRCQHPGDFHFQRINTGEIEQGFRRGNNKITWGQLEFHSYLGSDNALADHGEHPTLSKFNLSKIKVVQ